MLSIFILLLIYGAYLSLRGAIPTPERKGVISAAYSIFAFPTVPFFIFVMPRLVGGLHPGAQGDTSGSTPVAQLHMPLNMRLVFFLSLLGFSLFFFWLWNVRVRAARLEQTIFSNKQ